MLLSEYIQSSLLPDSPSIPQNLVLFWMETLVIHRISHNILAVCGFCMDFMLVKITETSPVAATLMNTLNCRTILFHKLQTLWWQYNRSNWAQFSTIPRLHPFNLIRNFFEASVRYTISKRCNPITLTFYDFSHWFFLLRQKYIKKVYSKCNKICWDNQIQRRLRKWQLFEISAGN